MEEEKESFDVWNIMYNSLKDKMKSLKDFKNNKIK